MMVNILKLFEIPGRLCSFWLDLATRQDAGCSARSQCEDSIP